MEEIVINRVLKLCVDKQKDVAENKPVIIAIDGRSASGKSTLADKLKEKLNASVVHMDDFFLPMELRTKERLEEPGGNVHYERFSDEVLSNLNCKKSFDYNVFDCKSMSISGKRYIDSCDFLIIEGSYSLNPLFGSYADIKIFLNTSFENQMERITERNGSVAAENFRAKWIPLEEKYFSAYEISKRADIVITS